MIINEWISSIGKQALYYCTELTSVEVPNSVTKIYPTAFNGCTGLTSIAIPNSEVLMLATDNEGGAGLSSKAYSLDGENWQSSNKFEVTKSGTYTVYVKDKLDNVSNKTIDVTITDPSDDKGDTKPSDQDSDDNKGSSDNKEQNNKGDGSQADTKIPDTGAYFPIAIILIAGIMSVILYRKYKKNKF